MSHHTKEKGDLAVAAVIADAARMGVKACVPLTEHLPFDLVLVNPECQLRRVQVRYASQKKQNIILRLRSSYSWAGGCKVVTLDRTKIDGFAVYCPDTEQTYYVRTDEIAPVVRCSVWLSLAPGAKWSASKYLG